MGLLHALFSSGLTPEEERYAAAYQNELDALLSKVGLAVPSWSSPKYVPVSKMSATIRTLLAAVEVLSDRIAVLERKIPSET